MVAPTKNQIIAQYQKDQQELNRMVEKISELEGVTNEVNAATQALGEIKKAKKDQKTMISLGAGVYIETKLDQSKTCKTCKKSLAGNVLVEQDIGKVMTRLEDEEKKARDALNKMYIERDRLQKSVSTLGTLLRQMEMQARKQQ